MLEKRFRKVKCSRCKVGRIHTTQELTQKSRWYVSKCDVCGFYNVTRQLRSEEVKEAMDQVACREVA